MGKLTINNLTKKFENQVVVDDVSLTVEDGEFLTVVGPSGCGKTTLLRMIAGFIDPSWGKICIDNDVLNDVSSNLKAVTPENRDIGMVFQSYAVWPHMNVFNNVAYPLKLRKVPKNEIKEKVEMALKLVHLEEFGKRMTYEMSGGQQQRVALARALVMRPRLLLLDEPLSNLDAALREVMRGEIKEIQRNLGITIINVTHDQTEAMTMSDKVAIMNKGKLVQFGTPVELYENPVNKFVAGFIGSANVIKAKKPVKARPDSDGMMQVEIFEGHTVRVPYCKSKNADGFMAFRAHNIVPDETSDIVGTVKGVQYLGNQFEYSVELGEERVRMLTDTDNQFEIDKNVAVRIEKALWLDE